MELYKSSVNNVAWYRYCIKHLQDKYKHNTNKNVKKATTDRPSMKIPTPSKGYWRLEFNTPLPILKFGTVREGQGRRSTYVREGVTERHQVWPITRVSHVTSQQLPSTFVYRSHRPLLNVHSHTCNRSPDHHTGSDQRSVGVLGNLKPAGRWLQGEDSGKGLRWSLAALKSTLR